MFRFQCLKKGSNDEECEYAEPEIFNEPRSEYVEASRTLPIERPSVPSFLRNIFRGPSRNLCPAFVKPNVSVQADSLREVDNNNSVDTVNPTAAIGQKKSLAEKLYDLTKYGWYWGPLTQEEANQKLLHEEDGSFLVRDSSSEEYFLTLSFKSQDTTYHTHIDHIGATFSIDNSSYCDSMEDLIEYNMKNYMIVNLRNDGKRLVRLSKPVSRFMEVRPLVYLCRFVIRQNIRADLRQQLPLPRHIIEFIEENQFF